MSRCPGCSRSSRRRRSSRSGCFGKHLARDAPSAATRASPAYSVVFRESLAAFTTWSLRKQAMTVLVFGFFFLASVATFFLPISIYEAGGSLRLVLLTAAIPVLPLTCSVFLGRLV